MPACDRFQYVSATVSCCCRWQQVAVTCCFPSWIFDRSNIFAEAAEEASMQRTRRDHGKTVRIFTEAGCH